MSDLEQALVEIQERNKRVEMQKAWEGSFTRRVFIVIVTYCTAFLYMDHALGVQDALLHALVPTGGYLLSTFSLPFIREAWMNKCYIKSEKTV